MSMFRARQSVLKTLGLNTFVIFLPIFLNILFHLLLLIAIYCNVELWEARVKQNY